MKELVYIAADHAGFKTKQKIIKLFEKNRIQYEDLGGTGKPSDDYPDFAFKVAKAVTKNKESKGILICGTGTGMVIAANKFKGVRASVGYDVYSVKKGREDNDINILCLRGRKFSDSRNLKFVSLFLKEKFSKEKRHLRRIKKLERR